MGKGKVGIMFSTGSARCMYNPKRKKKKKRRTAKILVGLVRRCDRSLDANTASVGRVLGRGSINVELSSAILDTLLSAPNSALVVEGGSIERVTPHALAVQGAQRGNVVGAVGAHAAEVLGGVGSVLGGEDADTARVDDVLWDRAANKGLVVTVLGAVGRAALAAAVVQGCVRRVVHLME
jgi:hypothetical protein